MVYEILCFRWMNQNEKSHQLCIYRIIFPTVPEEGSVLLLCRMQGIKKSQCLEKNILLILGQLLQQDNDPKHTSESTKSMERIRWMIMKPPAAPADINMLQKVLNPFTFCTFYCVIYVFLE